MKYSHPAALMALAVGGSLCSISPAMAAVNVTLALDQSAVYGGGTAKGTVTLSQTAPAGGVSVTLVSANPALVGVPATASVPGGKKTATFTVTTQPVSAYASVSITATYSGRSQVAKIALAPPAVRWLKFAPYTFAGGSRTTGTIYLSSPAPQGGIRVQVSVDNAAFVTVPDSVVVPAGSVTADFPVAASASPTRRYATISAGPGRFGGPVTGVLTILASTIPTPAAPTGLSAVPQWDPHCDACGGMAGPEAQLTWNSVLGANFYTIYRDNVALQSGISSPAFTDMTLSSGQTYSYAVSVTVNGKESVKSAVATVVGPYPPIDQTPSSMVAPPVNLAVRGLWNNGPNDVLTWTPVPGAVSYNVYQYSQKIASGLALPTYTVPISQFFGGAQYTVTAVGSNGMESIESQIAGAMGAMDPTNLPGWAGPWVPIQPETPTAITEINGGSARVVLTWRHVKDGVSIYRDGVKIADGIWGLRYIDATVNAGETHTYTIAGLNPYNPTRPESMQSGSATLQVTAATDASMASRSTMYRSHRIVCATAFRGHAKNYLSRGKKLSKETVRTAKDDNFTLPAVQIVKVVPGDDSALVVFNPVAGAADYRVYEQGHPEKVKYAGRFVSYAFDPYWHDSPTRSIQWNGLDPTKTTNLIVEAVDKLGPFQRMDGAMAPGTMTMDGMASTSINGQGDPSNVPNVLARSAPAPVTCTPSTFGTRGGSQVFFDNFRGSKPFTPVTNTPQVVIDSAGGAGQFAAYENDKWLIRDYQGDTANSLPFIMGNHLMDTLYDGGGPNASNVPAHNNNASLLFQPKAVADISGGKTLHVTFEVDAHLSGRRFLNLWVMNADEELLAPGKSTINGLGDALPTASGNAFLWDIQASNYDMNLLVGGQRFDLMQYTPDENKNWIARIESFGGPEQGNGSTLDLDKRHRFEFWLSESRYRFEEHDAEGNVLLSREKDFPAGVKLPFTRLKVLFGHEVYHSGVDRAELIDYNPEERYWINFRPYADERHWDNMGFEVLNAFPAF